MTTTLFGGSAVETETIRGSITRVKYAENGRCIASIALANESRKDREGQRRPATMDVLGSMAEPTIGQLYEFSGRITWDEKWCRHQMRFDSYRTILPDDRDGIISYLVDVAKWVGPAIAKQLTDAFGADTLTILKTDPEQVKALQIAGLTSDRIEEMRKTLAENEQLEAATVECNNILGGVLGPATVRKAIRKWGCDAATVIKADPFALTAIHGVGFLSADAVAKKLGRDPGDIRRHMAAAMHVISEAASREGHTVLEMTRVVMDANRLVGRLRPEVWEHCIRDEMVSSDGATVTLAELSAAEKYVAGKLASMMAGPRAAGDGDDAHAAERYARLFPAIDTDGLAPDQIAAVKAFETAPVFVLCGAPGTGKTYTVARIVKRLRSAGLGVALCAPTGKAAKQMSLALADICPSHARTIHSMLEPGIDFDTGEFHFNRDEYNPIQADVIVVDEFSMVDARLARSLLRAVKESTRLLIVGDHYQLPSVGPGAVLRDLLAASVPHYELREIKRNAGRIVRACHALKDGRVLAPSDRRFDPSDGDTNWRHIEAGSPAQIREVIEVMIRDKLGELDTDRLWGWQIISPVNERGELSCDRLNDMAKSIVNPAEPAPKGLKFARGDKVVRCKNGEVKGCVVEADNEEERKEYEKGGETDRQDSSVRVVNGDLGLVTSVTDSEIVVKFRFPERIAVIKRNDHQLKPAYCMTCHKMQGSEVDVVILPLHRQYARLPMVTREWIYTAFSRAKKMIVTVGDLDVIRPIVGKVGVNVRRTMLRGMLEQMRGFEL